jgi:isoleucyl-tRNA synthetase
VHLADWPEVKVEVHEELIAEMARVRALVSEALMLRQKVGIKVRQPLAKLTVPEAVSEDLKVFILDELNVKEVVTGSEFALDTELTLELVREGDEREMASAVAQARKAEGLAQSDVIETSVTPEGKYKVTLSTGEVHFDLVKNAA